MKNFDPSEEIIANRYQIIDILGQGGIATTYRALDTKTNTEVAIKTISLKGIGDWKQIELFEREAKILQQLEHPGIPKYLDYFEIDHTEDRYFYLVQQLASGKSLYELIVNGWCPDEQEVKNIASSILNILIYLQELSPPIIHRDIKPQNIIRQKNGEFFLVDFGAVADVYQHTFNSTVVGTFGYMSPEQYRGKATLATDIYGLGATLLFLLTQKCPSELSQHHLKINFRPHTEIDDHFANWLDKSIAPNPSERFENAKEALLALQEKTALESIQTTYSLRGSPVKLIDKHDKLLILIPPIWNRNLYSFAFSILPWLWYGAILLISILLLFNLDFSLSVQLFLQMSSWIFVFSLISITLYFIRLYPYHGFSEKKLIISRNYLKKNERMDFDVIIDYPHKAHLSKYKLFLRKKYISCCFLKCKLRNYRLGLFLTRRENEWLAKEINGFLAKD